MLGIIVNNNKTIFVRAEKLSQNGKNINKNYTYDIIGHNYKMSNLHASIGISQIKKFGEIKLKKIESDKFMKEHCKRNIKTLPKKKFKLYFVDKLYNL